MNQSLVWSDPSPLQALKNIHKRNPQIIFYLISPLMGLERETLRVTRHGELSKAIHPEIFGSKLTHSQVTTDFSENHLELITSPQKTFPHLKNELSSILKFVHKGLPLGEYLWGYSMPPHFLEEEVYPAFYGRSHQGMLKNIYRRGLIHRYPPVMQFISGTHFNLSFSPFLWDELVKTYSLGDCLQDLRDVTYFSMIRNLYRILPLLIYLFGGSPKMHSSFSKGIMDARGGDIVLSHRMGIGGYSSIYQRSFFKGTPLNSKNEYLDFLRTSLTTSFTPFEKMGIKDSQGDFLQLSTNLLQLEGEFYSLIRPKPSFNFQRQVTHLEETGVDYLEVRAFDLYPFTKDFLNEDALYFCLLLMIASFLMPSKDFSQDQWEILSRNMEEATMFPLSELVLQELQRFLEGTLLPMGMFLDEMYPGEISWRELCQRQIIKLQKKEQLPAYQILEFLGEDYEKSLSSLFRRTHSFWNESPLSPEEYLQEKNKSEESLRLQRELEEKTLRDEKAGKTFDHFLKNYDSLLRVRRDPA